MAAGFGRFGQERSGLGFGEFFLGLLALPAEVTDFFQRFVGLLRDVIDVGGEKRSGVALRSPQTWRPSTLLFCSTKAFSFWIAWSCRSVAI